MHTWHVASARSGLTDPAQTPTPHRHYGDTFKWLLWPDDDSVMYLDKVKQLLRHYDPELPHAISGR